MSELCGFPLEMVNEARAIQSTVQRLFPLLLQTTTVEPCVPLINRLVQELLELKGMATNDTDGTDDKEVMQQLYNIRNTVSEGDVEAIRAYLAHWSLPEAGVDERVEELLSSGRDELGHNYDPFASDHVTGGIQPPTHQTSTLVEGEMHTESLFGPTLSTTLKYKPSPTPAADEPCPKMTTAVTGAVSVGLEVPEPPTQPSLLDLLRQPGPAMSEVRSSQITPPVNTSNKGAIGAGRAMNTVSTLIGNIAKPVPVQASNPLSTTDAPSPTPAAAHTTAAGITHAPKVTTGRLSSFMAEIRGQLDISHDLTSEDQW